MSLLRSRVVFLVEPVVASALFALWLTVYAPPIADYVSMRSDMATGNPFTVVLAAAFAGAIALVRISPKVSFVLIAVALIVQLLGWPSRFTLTSWVAYGFLVVAAFGGGLYATGAVRQVAKVAAIPLAALVAALLNLPLLSLSGTFGLINGKTNDALDVPAGFAVSTLVMLGLLTLGWVAGSRLRRPAAVNPGAATDPETGIAGSEHLAALSAREREIYALVVRGFSTAEIAAVAHIEESTVKSHISSILSKLGLTSRTALVVHAYQNGLVLTDGSPRQED